MDDALRLNDLARNMNTTIADDIAQAALEDDNPNDDDDGGDGAIPPLSISEALQQISELLSGGKKKVALHPAAAAPLAILRNFFIRRIKGNGILLASQSVAGM